MMNRHLFGSYLLIVIIILLTGCPEPPPVEESVPPRVAGVQAVADDGRIDIRWIGNSTDVTGYNIYRCTRDDNDEDACTIDSDDDFVLVCADIDNCKSPAITDVNTTSYLDTTAMNDVKYYYRVSAINKIGEGPRGSIVTGKPFSSLEPITTVTVEADDGQVLLQWGDVEGAIGYNIYRSSALFGRYRQLGDTILIDQDMRLSYIDDTVYNGTTYFYNMSAVNDFGEGPRMDIPAFARPIGSPGQLTGVDATKVVKGQIEIRWDQYRGTITYAIIGYNVYRSITEDGEFIRLCADSNNNCDNLTLTVANNNATTYLDNAIEPNTDYYYRMTTVNRISSEAQREGPPSDITGPVRVPEKADKPVVVAEQITISRSQVNITWDNVSEATEYRLYRSNSPSGSFRLSGTLPAVAGATTTTHTDDQIQLGIFYYYRVSVVNEFGEGQLSEASEPAVVISAVTGITIVSGDGQVTINWVPVIGATGYNIYRLISLNPADRSNALDLDRYTRVGQDEPTVAGGNIQTYIDNDVENGTTYYYIMGAFHPSGEGMRVVNLAHLVTPASIGTDPPAQPTGVTVTPGDGRVTLRWNKGGDATGYNIYRSTASTTPDRLGGGDITYPVSALSPNIIIYPDGSVTNETEYLYYVRAVNENGEGEASDSFSATPSIYDGATQRIVVSGTIPPRTDMFTPTANAHVHAYQISLAAASRWRIRFSYTGDARGASFGCTFYDSERNPVSPHYITESMEDSGITIFRSNRDGCEFTYDNVYGEVREYYVVFDVARLTPYISYEIETTITREQISQTVLDQVDLFGR